MWLFNKKPTLSGSGLFEGLTDCHSHILPGVDDGIKTAADSLAVLSCFERLGVKEVWLTPHIMEDVPNSPADLRRRFDELCAMYSGPVKLNLAAEHMLDALFMERLAADDVLPFGHDGRYLLVETSYAMAPSGLEAMLDDIRHKGYYPLLAHPERYIYMDEAQYKRLKGSGVYFQSNITSFVGAFGKGARKKAEWLLQKGMTDALGSDLHRLEVYESFTGHQLTSSKVAGALLALRSPEMLD